MLGRRTAGQLTSERTAVVGQDDLTVRNLPLSGLSAAIHGSFRFGGTRGLNILQPAAPSCMVSTEQKRVIMSGWDSWREVDLMNRVAAVCMGLGLLVAAPVHAQNSSDASVRKIRQELRALHWVIGPKTVAVAGNSKLALPDGYVYLDAAETTKFQTINQNFSDGKEVMIGPKSLAWFAFLEFDDAGYVRDTEKINAPAVLKSLIDNTNAANAARERRGWSPLHVVGWSRQPEYNKATRRLEWAVRVRSVNGETTNFFTKVLGRRGYASVVLVAAPKDASGAISSLDQVLTGYHFNAGERYADYQPGDKVAKYGLVGLILGGAAAVAVKTGVFAGLLKFLIAGAAAAWKFIVAAVAAVMASLRSFFKRRKARNVPKDS